MAKLRKYIPRFILLDTFIIAALYTISELTLRCFGLMFRQRVFWIVAALTALGLIAGSAQLLLRIKNKVVKIIFIVIFAALTLVSINFAFLLAIFTYEPEYVVERDGAKYTAYVYSTFKDSAVYYYDYKGPFVTGGKLRIKEHYGYLVDPFGEYVDIPPDTTYYDEDGNIAEPPDYD